MPVFGSPPVAPLVLVQGPWWSPVGTFGFGAGFLAVGWGFIAFCVASYSHWTCSCFESYVGQVRVRPVKRCGTFKKRAGGRKVRVVIGVCVLPDSTFGAG